MVFSPVVLMQRNRKGPGNLPGPSKFHETLIYSAPQRLKTSEPLVPPKPKLLESA